jgi:hypothetical protein
VKPQSPFQRAASEFLAQPKIAVGAPKWQVARTPPDQACFWTLEIDGVATPHQLRVEARLAGGIGAFCVMAMFHWHGRNYPVLRLNQDPIERYHLNHPPRPIGVPAIVRGPRIYLWDDNRTTFQPSMLGLPFARELDRKLHQMDNAIRHMADLAKISLPPGALPEYPRRADLFG